MVLLGTPRILDLKLLNTLSLLEGNLRGEGKGEKRRASPKLLVPSFGGLVPLTYNMSKGF